MKYPEITRLYKFYAYNVNSLSVLINRAFWFTKPDSFNDPFDCKVPFDNRINLEELRRFLPRYRRYRGISKKQAEKDIQQIIDSKGQADTKFTEVWSIVLKAADEDLRNSGVFCLSQCNTNILMWSHYADNHKGFCIEFVRGPQNVLGDYDKTRPVKYRAEYPVISPLSLKAPDLKFWSKAADWKYEKEWRLINPQGDIEIPLSVEIFAIIFGLDMTERHKTTIRNIVPNTRYRQCTKVSNQFGLKIVDL